MFTCPDRYTQMRNNSNRLHNSMERRISAPERKLHMVVGLSVVGGLLLAGFAFSLLRARRDTKNNVLKLFS